MRTVVRLAAFAAALVALLAAGAFVGAAMGPFDRERPEGVSGEESMPAIGEGLVVGAEGYTLVPAVTVLEANIPQAWSFAITGKGGDAVTAFDVEHDKELHLIIADRQLTTYAHLHPERDVRGRWTAHLP